MQTNHLLGVLQDRAGSLGRGPSLWHSMLRGTASGLFLCPRGASVTGSAATPAANKWVKKEAGGGGGGGHGHRMALLRTRHMCWGDTLGEGRA